jgi:hypothetical protein
MDWLYIENHLWPQSAVREYKEYGIYDFSPYYVSHMWGFSKHYVGYTYKLNMSSGNTLNMWVLFPRTAPKLLHESPVAWNQMVSVTVFGETESQLKNTLYSVIG